MSDEELYDYYDIMGYIPASVRERTRKKNEHINRKEKHSDDNSQVESLDTGN